MQTVRLDDSAELDPAEATPFRAAFAQARRNGRQTAAVAGADGQVDGQWGGSWFEVRIEKRLKGRAADEARWNKLGRRGWELVAVDGKHAFFRREHRPA